MYRIGQAEIDALAKVIRDGPFFRYDEDNACDAAERGLQAYLGAAHVCLSSSGNTALIAAMASVGLGPGDEVLVPAHAYLACATAVVAVGAIPVIVDIDASITIDPDAIATAIGPRTRAVIPVHMWGLVCNLSAIIDVAQRHNLIVIEDACQCVGGRFHNRCIGTWGNVGAMSFNAYKNITCGEGGAVITDDAKAAARARCMIDGCNFFWKGGSDDLRPFCSSGTRASVFGGALLAAQLERLPDMLSAMRRQKDTILEATSDLHLQPNPRHDPAGECATHVMFLLPDAAQAERFAEAMGATVLHRTGRHTFTDWEPILQKRGAHHPALDPFRMAANQGCRMDYRPDMCPVSRDILARTVSLPNHPDRTDAELDALIQQIRDFSL